MVRWASELKLPLKTTKMKEKKTPAEMYLLQPCEANHFQVI